MMGLDVSHEAFHGAYSAFNRFRQVVAKSIGGSYPPHNDASLDETQWYWKSNEAANPGLKVFFNHSDCDGEIDPEVCAKLADEMEAILPLIDAMGIGGGHIERQGGYGKVARRFIAGCRAAHAANESLEFG